MIELRDRSSCEFIIIASMAKSRFERIALNTNSS